MVQANPYAAPTSDLIVESDVDFGDAAIFSFRSRAGRLRYLARTGLSTLAGYAILAIVAVIAVAASGNDPNAALTGVFVGYGLFLIVAIVFGLMFAAQRLHDMNHTAWMALLMFVPLVNVALGLYLLFGRGTASANDFGPPPPPNSIGVKLAAWSFIVLIFVVGIAAAISIPAYQDYVMRAQQSQQLQVD